MNGLTTQLPSSALANFELTQFKDIQLADPTFATPGRIDIIIGTDYYSQIILDGLIRWDQDGPIARNTIFGWIVIGSVIHTRLQSVTTLHALTSYQAPNLQDLLARFWVQEEVPETNHDLLTLDEQECEAHFKRTHQRNSSGRYIVRLPFKNQPSQLGDSYTMVFRCLQHLTRRLNNDTWLKTLYTEFMTEYLQLKHMALSNSSPADPGYFLPHHGVRKTTNNTQKIRVVFNGSKPTSSGFSLNALMHTGPKLLNNIFDVLIRIRLFKYIFLTDIAKMYRQILVHEDDQHLQQILWFDQFGKIEPFKLATVTYGTTAAPYLAVRALLQLVEDEGHKFPLAITPLTLGRYVDDISGGADDLETLQQVANQTEQLCMAGGFPLAKWASNFRKLNQLNHAEAITQYKFEDLDTSTKILGMFWSPARDQFFFQHSPPESAPACTKRAILSEIAQIFDPLGFLSPLIIQAKVFMQELWLVKLGWDTPLPALLHQAWKSFKQELASIKTIAFPRWIHSSTCSSSIEIHEFSDASNKAMAAAVLIKVHTHAQKARVALLCAKTKVSSLKQMTIPRLELTAAHMLAKLIKHCQITRKLTHAPTYLWTDLTITLTWIHSHPLRWKDFVRNRVSQIQDLIPDGHWKFVPGTENPADCATRGLTTAQLKDHQLWWTGLPWLLKNSSSWPSSPTHLDADIELEERPVKAFYSSAQPLESLWPLMDRPLPLLRVLRVIAIYWRVRDIIKHKPNSSLHHAITSDEVSLVLQFCIKETQRTHFNYELQLLNKQASWPKDHPFTRLVAFLDTDGIIQVSGRLDNAPVRDQQRHPAILPRDAPLTRLIISDAHQRTLHGGIQLNLALKRQKYWILGGRQPVRSFILKCLKCARHRGIRAQQLMGQLPAPRVTPSPPFSHTGVDYAGPITLKTSSGREAKTYKGWIFVFVCLCTSAVHLELVSNYSASGFIAALRRFISRRGVCAHLYSDCGTTFQGANSELKQLFAQGTQQSSSILAWVSRDQISWHFNPPAAPHMGGKWGAAIESILNSRPLEAITEDPQDLTALTPGHFLIGRELNSIPEPSLMEINISRLSRWQFIQQRAQHFWKHWSISYVHQQLARTKWYNARQDIKIGSLVLLTDERAPPNKWPLAKVTQIHPGQDGLPQVVSIKTVTGTFVRPISKLAPLPLAPEPDS